MVQVSTLGKRQFASLRPVVPKRQGRGSAKALSDSFHRLAKAIGPSGESATIDVEIRRGGTWRLGLKKDATVVAPHGSTKANLHVTLDSSDWWAILRGDVSPFEVFLQGRIRMVGNCGIAERLVAKLAGAGEREL